MLAASASGSLRPTACMVESQHSIHSASKWRRSQCEPRTESSDAAKKQRTVTLSDNTSVTKRRLRMEDIPMSKDSVPVMTQEATELTISNKMPNTSMSAINLSASAKSATESMLHTEGALKEAQVEPKAAVSHPELAKPPLMDTPTKGEKRKFSPVGQSEGQQADTHGFPLETHSPWKNPLNNSPVDSHYNLVCRATSDAVYDPTGLHMRQSNMCYSEALRERRDELQDLSGDCIRESSHVLHFVKKKTARIPDVSKPASTPKGTSSGHHGRTATERIQAEEADWDKETFQGHASRAAQLAENSVVETQVKEGIARKGNDTQLQKRTSQMLRRMITLGPSINVFTDSIPLTPPNTAPLWNVHSARRAMAYFNEWRLSQQYPNYQSPGCKSPLRQAQ